MENQILNLITNTFGQQINEHGNFGNYTFHQILFFLGINIDGHRAATLLRVLNNEEQADENFIRRINQSIERYNTRRIAYGNFITSLQNCYDGAIPIAADLARDLGVGNQIDNNALNFDESRKTAGWYNRYTQLVQNFHARRRLEVIQKEYGGIENIKKNLKNLKDLRKNSESLKSIIDTQKTEINHLKPFKENNELLKKQIDTLKKEKNEAAKDFETKEIAFNNVKAKLNKEINRLELFETSSNNLNIEVKQLTKRTKWLSIISILLLFTTIFFFKKICALQKEITNIEHWYINPDSILTETYPFLKNNSDFKNSIDILKEKSITFENITVDIDACVINPSKKNNFNSLDTFKLSGKVYLARKFFIMEDGTLMDDSDLKNDYTIDGIHTTDSIQPIDSLPFRFIQAITNFIDDNNISKDKNYLSNLLEIGELDNSRVLANLAYLAVLDTTRQIMVRFPAYREFEEERMKAYKFEDRPWSPFKYENDTTYLTQPYGDIRNGLMPVRTYVHYFHKMYQGRKIKIAIGVDFIYDVEEKSLFSEFFKD